MFATVDPVFRGRGPRNQYIPPITEENLQDNAYVNMKRGGKVVKKKGKATATATATQVVNVYTGRRGRRTNAPSQPRPPPQVNITLQNPFEFMREPMRMMRMAGNEPNRPNLMPQPTVPLSFDPNPRPKDSFEPLDSKMLLPFNAEPLDQKVLKRELEPLENKHMDELFLEEADLLPLPPPPQREAERLGEAAQAAGGEPRRRRTKEEMEEARREGEIRRVELRQEILKGLMDRLSEERARKPDSPFIKKLEKDIEKFMARR
jgi:ribosomal protein L12E/L44/L45/RPP1/RPP2